MQIVRYVQELLIFIFLLDFISQSSNNQKGHMESFFLLLVISVPFFYIVGLASFITYLSRLFQGKDEKLDSREKYLSRVIAELASLGRNHPQKTLHTQIEEYAKELEEIRRAKGSSYQPQEAPLGFSIPSSPTQAFGKSKPALEYKRDVWESWYSDNSINLLLYIGAFLIVASASIYVGFQWETIGGIVKAVILSLLTIAFLGSGVIFYRIPKIKNAGATFIAISALLLPFNGLAWYNFVLGPHGYSAGFVWLLTSLVAGVSYTTLAYTLRSHLYSYIAGVSGLSLILSFVNATSFPQEWYVLGGIVYAFTLLLLTKLLSSSYTKDLFSFPLLACAHVIMPCSLVFGLLLAVQNGSLYSLESAVGVLLAAGYYFLAYSMTKLVYFYTVSILLIPYGIFLLLEFLGIGKIGSFYVLQTVFVGYVGVSYWLRKHLLTESNATLVVGLTAVVLLILYGLGGSVGAIHVMTACFVGACLGVAGYQFTRERLSFLYHGVLLAFGLYLSVFDVLGFSQQWHILGVVYLLLSVVYYAIFRFSPKEQGEESLYTLTSVGFGGLALLLTLSEPLYATIGTVVVALLLLDYALKTKEKSLYYGVTVLFFVTTWSVLRLVNMPPDMYPLAFGFVSSVYYVLGLSLRGDIAYSLRSSGMGGILFSSGFFGFLSLGNAYDYEVVGNIQEMNALAVAYGAVVMFAYDAFSRKSKQLGYTASAIAMATFLWQMKYFSLEEWQIYTLPLSLYFMILAYLQKREGNHDNRVLFDVVGLLFLFVPTFIQSFGDNGFLYALLMGVEAIILFGIGISLAYPLYTYAGVGALFVAVISQTYEFLFSLPRWILTAVFGLFFLLAAIYLLLRRKEGDKESHQ